MFRDSEADTIFLEVVQILQVVFVVFNYENVTLVPSVAIDRKKKTDFSLHVEKCYLHVFRIQKKQ